MKYTTHLALTLILGVSLCAGSAMAQPLGGFRSLNQPENPVYVDDSPAATDTLARVPQLVESGNHTEAIRALQTLLTSEPDRVVASDGEATLFESVRSRVHRTLLGSPELLARYRTTRGPVADAMLASGQIREVEAAFLLTSAGFEAALRVAQTHIEAARFEAARLTLEQLESHPDREGPAGTEAGAMMALVARFLNRDEVWETASRWSGRQAAREPLAWPTGATALSHDLFGRGTDGLWIGDEEIPQRPLWSAPLADRVPQEMARGRSQRGPWLGLWIYPTVSQGMVFINDGQRIRAWDRYTLEMKWETAPAAGPGHGISDTVQRQRVAMARSVDDVACVTVSGDRLYAVTGIPIDGQRDGDPRLHALHTQTGQVLWSAQPSAMDDRLAFTAIRGDVLADVDSVVVPVRRAIQTQRVVTAYLASFDARGGSLRWVRPLGSAGAMSYQRARGVAEGGVLHEGVVYVSDPIGVYAAVEAFTGRPIWVRVFPTTTDFGQVDRGSAWEANRPLVTKEHMLLLPADRRDLIALDRRTGAIAARRPLPSIRAPRYLVRVGDSVAIAGATTIGFTSIHDVSASPLRVFDRLGDGGARGRIVAARDRAIVPAANGVIVIDPNEPTEVAQRVDLEFQGMTLPLGDQIVVADDTSLHSFLSWEAADRLLSRRIVEHPDDPRAAVSMAELAYRGGRASRITSAADIALDAIMRDPSSERNKAARERLFAALLEMVESAQAVWQAMPGDPKAGSVLTLDDLAAVATRLGRAAGSNEEQVSHLMALGWLSQVRQKPREAIEAYQQILASDALSRTRWNGPVLASRADVAAARSIKIVVEEFGPNVYAPFDAEALRELSMLAPGAPAREIESLARRYPVSRHAPTLWMLGAEAHQRAGRGGDARAALFRAVSAAEAQRPAVDQALLGEAAGRLIEALRGAGRTMTASFVLDRLSRDHPDLVLTVTGAPVERASLMAQLAEASRATSRLPALGLDIDGDPQVIEGWTIMPALSLPQRPTATESVMLLSSVSAEVALWGVSGAQPPGAMPGTNPEGLTRLWSRSYEGRPPRLLRQDPGEVYLVWFTARGASIECIDAVDGSSRWRTPAFAAMFEPDPAFAQRMMGVAGRPVEFETPLLGSVRVTDLVVSLSDETITMAERSGRVAMIEKATGRVVGATTSVVGAVFDVASGHGWVAVAGAAERPTPELGLAASSPMLAVYDAKTGAKVLAMSDIDDPIRWVRVLDAQRLLAATDTRVMVIDPRTGDVTWDLVGAGTVGTRDGWIFGDRLYLLSNESALFGGRLGDARLADEPLETLDRMDARLITRASRVGSNVAFSTSRGLVLYDGEGALAGVDAIGAVQGVLPPEPSESLFVMVELAPRAIEGQPPAFTMHLLTSRSASLVRTHYLALRETPSALAVLDGAVALSAANVTIVYPMPP